MRRIILRMAPRLLALSTLALVMEGCTYWNFEGNGPCPKAEAYKRLGRAPRMLPADLKQKAEQLYKDIEWQDVPFEFADWGDRDVRFKKEKKMNLWSGLLGYLPTQTIAITKKKDITERAYAKGLAFVPGWPFLPLWWQGSETWYSMDSGEEISSVSFAGLGPGMVFGGTTCSIRPTDRPRFYALKGENCLYDVKHGWHAVAGLVGSGTVNGRRYLQLFWIPIRL